MAPSNPAAGEINALFRALGEAPKPRRAELLTQLCTQIAAGESFVDPNEDSVEWRGLAQGFPIRVQISGGWAYITVKAASRFGSLELELDPTKVPAVGAPPSWDDSDHSLIFIGRGVFFGSLGGKAELQAQRFSHLPAEARTAIVTAIQRDKLQVLRVRADIVARFAEGLYSMPDPADRIVRVAQLCVWMAQGLASLPPDPAPTGASAGLHPIACKYCNTLFALGVQSNCPNCGAPPQA